MQLRLGTRRSALARWQADWVTRQLEQRGIAVEQILITTQGDAKSGPIGAIGEQGVFTKEIQRALLEHEIDLAVHSLKDLPTDPVEGLTLAAVPAREANGDAWISRQGVSFQDASSGCTVGTGSVRRRAQLLHLNPSLDVRDIRGNVDTRLQKLDDEQYDAIVLAEAGLRRLQCQDRITEIFPREQLLPAIGQGALGIEARADDADTLSALQPLNDNVSRAAVTAERSLLAALRGGCLAPIGGWARQEGDQLQLDAVVLSGDGTVRLTASHRGSLDEARELGQAVADDLTSQGADKLLSR